MTIEERLQRLECPGWSFGPRSWGITPAQKESMESRLQRLEELAGIGKDSHRFTGLTRREHDLLSEVVKFAGLDVNVTTTTGWNHADKTAYVYDMTITKP